MRVFLAGATGVIGIRLVPLLIAAGHTVAGMTRSEDKTERLAALAAQPVVCDVFDLPTLTKAVTDFAPEAVLHEMTDLPDRLDDLGEYAARKRARGSSCRPHVGPAAAGPRREAASGARQPRELRNPADSRPGTW